MIHHKSRPILYVDDTVEQRYAMRRILETEGLTVLEAGTGKEALALMGNSPALAVVDVKLPDMSGYELSRRMKEISPHLQLLQVSASFSDPSLRVSGLSGGADAYLAQPVYPSELVTLVRRMLRTAEAEETLRFLASIGPRMTQSLSIADTVENIVAAVTPRFATWCHIFLEKSPGCRESLFPPVGSGDEELLPAMKSQCAARDIRMINSRLIIAALSSREASIGAIALQLDEHREYTESDLILAEDLANRAALALQNCILFSSEQLTRSALIQSEKLATAGRMTGAIAHEINNPLEALTNLLYILQNSPDASQSVQELASAALTEVTRIAHITRQTLGFYRDLRIPSTLALAESVSDTLELYGRRFAEKGIAIERSLDETIRINGIRGEISQVISNLLINALEAMESGGKLDIRVFSEADEAVLSISDNGTGIKEDVIENIFEPFFTTKQGTGTGLGLWITQTIVEKHAGEIVTSTRRGGEDHGTCFEIRFPRV